MTASFIRSEEIAPGVFCFWFETEQKLSFQAGQFTELTLPHDNADERGIRRWFTISSSPTEDLVAITTRRSESMSTFKQTLFTLKPSHQVKLAQPMGDFVLPIQTSIPVIFVISGIGVTPLRSIVKYLIDTKSNRNISVIYLSRSPSDRIYASMIEAFTPLVTYHKNDADGLAHVKEAVLSVMKEKPGSLVYLSGPEQFVEKAYDGLRSADVANSKIITDYFHGYNTD